MKITAARTLVISLLAVLCLAPPAQARNERLLFTVEGALSRATAKDRLDDTVQFFFGDQAFPEPVEKFGIYTVERTTNALTKTDVEACDWVFLSALLALRDRAKEVGANAVVNIKSIYKSREFVSETDYECRAGWFVTGASLEGRVVKLPPPGVSTIPQGR